MELKQKLSRFNQLFRADRLPLWYAVVIVSCIMYYYGGDGWVAFAAAGFLIQLVLFRFYDYVNQHHVQGGILYFFLMVLLGFVCQFLTNWAVTVDAYPIEFYIWALTPQSVVDFSLPYTLIMLLLFSGFISSVTYYFSIVRYRYFMSFLVMMIPFAIYARESEAMPVLFIILLLLLYFAVMIDTQQLQGVSERFRKKSRSACGLFLAVASALVMALPKPSVTADRDYLERMLDLSALSDYLMEAIQGFADSSDGGSYRTGESLNQTLFAIRAEAPMILKTRTFSQYQYEDDAWHACEAYDTEEQAVVFEELDNPQAFYDALSAVLSEHPELAANYGLEDAAALPIPDIPVAEYAVQELRGKHTFFLSPSQPAWLSVSGWSGNSALRKTSNGAYFRSGFRNSLSYSVQYYPSVLREEPMAATLAERLSLTQWSALLEEAEAVSGSAAIAVYRDTCRDAEAYWLQTYEAHSNLTALAEEITEGCTNDLQRADAIADYFDQGFTYDLEFQKPEGGNIETFLFETKTGVCYDFASAMTLLCRAAGIPARYCEGYSTGQAAEENSDGTLTFLVGTSQAHAFTEVYISGYGWMYFDPTIVSSGTAMDSAAVKHMIQKIGIAVLLLSAILLLGWRFLGPALEEWWFRRKLRRSEPAQRAILLQCRMRKQMRATPSETPAELCSRLLLEGTDCTALFEAAEQALYGGASPTPEQLAAAVAVYETYLADRKRRRKEERRKRRTMAHSEERRESQ